MHKLFINCSQLNLELTIHFLLTLNKDKNIIIKLALNY